MLRAKQISNLSNCARTILYSGSRCSPADGSSCSCPEDENCLSRRQPRKDLLVQPKSSPFVSRPAVARVVSLPSGDGLKAGTSEKYENVHPSTTVSQPTVAPTALGRSECVRYAVDSDAEQEHALSTSPHMADQLLKAGIAAASLLSDLVNYKLPVSDGSGTTQNINYMVSPARTPSNVKSSNVKSVKKASFYSVHRKSPSVKVVPDSTGSGQSSRQPCSNDNHVPAKGYTRSSSRELENPVEVQDVYASRATYVRRGSKAGTSHHESLPSVSNVQTSKAKPIGRAPHCLNMHHKDTKLQTGSIPAVRQSVSTVQVVEGVLDILGTMRWGPAAEAALDKLNFSMDAYQGNQVLKQIKDYSVALGFFNWLKRQPRFKHDGHTYTTMVGILGRARQFDTINILLSEMIADGCQPNVVTYNRLIHSYGRANYLNEALNVFNRMQAAGCQPDRVTYCTLIDIHAKAGYFDVAMYMYQRMLEARLSPDTFTYSVIINCLGKAGHLASAHKLFCEMVDQGCLPNLVTYNIMIALQAKARNYPVALEIYRDMKNTGHEPDKVTYSIVMEVLGHCGYLEEAEGIFSEMKRKNWVPDEPVYGLLVDLWGKVGNAGKALSWYQAMLNAGLFPNVPTCNSLLSAFLRVHRLVDAYNLLQSMLQMGLRPSLQTYTLLLSNSTEAKSSFDMGFCGQLMAITGHPAHAFLLSMPPAGPDGQNVRDHVGRFLDLMHSEDRESKRGLVDAVVDFLHKSGLKEEAGSVWEVAAEKNVYPDAVKEKSKYYWLINLHVMSDGTAVTALSRTLAWFRRQLLVSGVGPSRIDIVTGWGRRSRVTGSSLVRQAVQELLDLFSFPFFTENGNSGCFVGCGEPLNRWLMQSYVERMHLL